MPFQLEAEQEGAGLEGQHKGFKEDQSTWTYLSVATATQRTISRYSINQDYWKLYEQSPFRPLRYD